MLTHPPAGPPPTPLPLPIQTVGTGSGYDEGDDTVSPVTVLPLLESTSPIARRRNTKHGYKRLGQYILLGTLGEGEFGKVKLGKHVDTHQKVAVKLITKANVNSSSRMEKIQREIAVLKSLRHPNIVKLLDVIENRKYIGIILEYAPGGELYEYILANSILTEEKASQLFAQLVSSVRYMHEKYTVHRDLKLENLLLDDCHESILVTDFGFANRFDRNGNDLMSTSCGSPCYAAPELVMNTDGAYHGAAADIWSCGVILYAMLCGYLPYDDDPDNPEGQHVGRLYNYIMTTPLVFREPLSPEARDLTSMMLQPDPKQRCSFEDIVQHPWLQKHKVLFEKAHSEFEKEAEQVVQDLRSIRNEETSAIGNDDDESILTTHSSSSSHRYLKNAKRDKDDVDQDSIISSNSSTSGSSGSVHRFPQEEIEAAGYSKHKDDAACDRRASVYAMARPTSVQLPPSTPSTQRLSKIGKFSFGRHDPAKPSSQPKPTASLRRQRRHTHLIRLFTGHTKQRSTDETPTLTVHKAPSQEELQQKAKPRTRLFSTLRIADRPKSLQLQTSLRAYFHSKDGHLNTPSPSPTPTPSPSPSHGRLSTTEKTRASDDASQHQLASYPEREMKPPMMDSTAQKPPVGNRVMAWIKRRSHSISGKHSLLQENGLHSHPLVSRASSPAQLALDDELNVVTSPYSPADLHQRLHGISAALGMETTIKGGYKLECVRPPTVVSALAGDNGSIARSNEAQRHFKLDEDGEDDRSVSMASNKTGGGAPVTTATTVLNATTAPESSVSILSNFVAEPIYGHPAKDPGLQVKFIIDISQPFTGQSKITFTRLSGDAWTYAFLRRKMLQFIHLYNMYSVDNL